MRDTLNGVPWIPIPNLGSGVHHFLNRWKIDAVILTGGNDLGESSQRDDTEKQVLNYCSERNLPVLGICRGLQVLQAYYGGRIDAAPEEQHLKVFHKLQVSHPLGKRIFKSVCITTNSYHRFGVRLEGLSPELEPWLLSADGFVEGIFHRKKRQMAVQWHPERSLPDPEVSVRLLRHFWNG